MKGVYHSHPSGYNGLSPKDVWDADNLYGVPIGATWTRSDGSMVTDIYAPEYRVNRAQDMPRGNQGYEPSFPDNHARIVE